MPRRALFAFLLAAVLAAAPAAAQQNLHDLPLAAAAERAGPGLGDVGLDLLSDAAARAYRAERAPSPVRRAERQRQEEVTREEFTRGALVGGLAGMAAGAAVGALLGGDRNARIETALPVAMAGLAVGAPAGVYIHTGRSSRYLWGTVGAAGAVAATTAVYLVETR